MELRLLSSPVRCSYSALGFQLNLVNHQTRHCFVALFQKYNSRCIVRLASRSLSLGHLIHILCLNSLCSIVKSLVQPPASPSYIFEFPCSSRLFIYPLFCSFHLNLDRMQALTCPWTSLSYMAFGPALYNIRLVQHLGKSFKLINSQIPISETLQDFQICLYIFI